jgi:predicted DNA-binding protein (UPF0251 family)
LYVVRGADYGVAGKHAEVWTKKIGKARKGFDPKNKSKFAARRECLMNTIPFLTACANGETPVCLPRRKFSGALRWRRPEDPANEEYVSNDPDIWLYRDRTAALLRRYFRISIEVGRLPSLMGREVFRGKVTAYKMRTFEDAVIFIHDVERALEELDDFERELISRILFQEYTQDEAARLLGCWRRTVGRRFPEALDRMSEIFLEGGLLRRFQEPAKSALQDCQEEEVALNSVTASIGGK